MNLGTLNAISTATNPSLQSLRTLPYTSTCERCSLHPTMAAAASRRVGGTPPLLDPAHQRGLTSLLSQTYGKPVHLNLVKLQRPHDDPDILAQFVTQKLRDRKNSPRRVIRDAAWKADLPSALAITKKQQELHSRRVAQARDPLTLDKLTLGGAQKISEVVKDLAPPQVSSVRVQAAGRLSKRITANQADSKVAIRGTTKKKPTHIVRGTIKANQAQAQRSGKRRIGVYGVRVDLGYS